MGVLLFDWVTTVFVRVRTLLEAATGKPSAFQYTAESHGLSAFAFRWRRLIFVTALWVAMRTARFRLDPKALFYIQH
jgi:hypothetical protein